MFFSHERRSRVRLSLSRPSSLAFAFRSPGPPRVPYSLASASTTRGPTLFAKTSPRARATSAGVPSFSTSATSAGYVPSRFPRKLASLVLASATSASVAGLAALAYMADAAAFLTEAYVHPGPRMPPPETGRDDLAPGLVHAIVAVLIYALLARRRRCCESKQRSGKRE